MPMKVLKTCLFIVAVVGGVLTYRASREHQRLTVEYDRLEKLVGDITVDDPTRMHVRALDTGEDLHFAWRVYLPAGFRTRWDQSNGIGTCSQQRRDSCEFIARVRFWEEKDGRLGVFCKKASGSGHSSLGDQKLAELLRGRWDEIQVEQLGSDGLAVVESDEVAVMLRLTLSDELKREADRKLKKFWSKHWQTELFSLRLGTVKAFDRAKASIPLKSGGTM